MIHIEQDQVLKADNKIRVAVPTGDYNETDLIECYVEGEDPNVPTCMYQAQFVAFGGPVYEQSEELTEDQLNALIANTPIHEVINNRKLIDGKKPASKYVGRIIKRKGKLDVKKLRTDIVDDTATTTKKAVLKQTDPVNVATSTQPVANNVSNATTTTPVYNASGVSTSTQPIYSSATSTESFYNSASSTPSTVVASSTEPVYVSPDVTATSTATSSDSTEYSSSQDSSSATSTNPFSSIEDTLGEVSTSTDQTNFGGVTDTVSEPIQSVQESTPVNSSTDSSTTTDQIVAYAKRKIAKKLGF